MRGGDDGGDGGDEGLVDVGGLVCEEGVEVVVLEVVVAR